MPAEIVHLVQQPVLHSIPVSGVDLAVFEWGASFRGDSPSIVLVHATGFHARCWDQVIRYFGERHVLALDQRGHGRSGKAEITHWSSFTEDLVAVVDALEIEGAIGAGHSMGGHVLTDAAARRPQSFRRLVLLDPVILSPDHYEGGWQISLPDGEPHPTAKRKRYFASADEMFERFADRAPYSVFRREALRDYCDFGIVPVAEGGFELACLPETEASVYLTSRTNAGIHDSIRAVDLPVLVVRARRPPPQRGVMDFGSSPTWPALADAFADGRDLHLEDHSHFLPMEIPERVASLVLGF